MQKYANQVLPYYLLSNQVETQNHRFYLSQAVEVSNAESLGTYIFFVFSDDECIGQLTVSLVEAGYASSFILKSIPEVTQAYLTKSPIALSAHDETLFLSVLGNLIPLNFAQMTRRSKIETVSSISISSGASCIVTRTEVLLELPAQTRNYSPVENLYLNVPIVSNASSPDTGDGLCWTACIASMGAYRNNTMPLSALQIYEWLDENHFDLLEPYPVGNRGYTEKGFEYVNMDCIYFAGGLEFSDIKLYIQNDMPICTCIRREGGSHAVVICGYQKYPGAQMLRLMDPNMENYVSVYIADGATDFTYATSYGFTYTECAYRYNEALYYEDL